MKSLSQFLEESYLGEEEARQGSLFTRSGKPQNFKNPKKVPFTATDPTPIPASRRLPAASSQGSKPSPGQLDIPEPKNTKVTGSSVRNAGEARQGSLFTKSGKPQNFKNPKKVPFVGTEPVKAAKRFSAGAPEAPKSSPGQMNIDFNANPNKGGQLATRSSSSPVKPFKPVEVRDVTNPRRTAADLKAKRAAAGTGPSGKSIITPPPSPSGGKPPSGSKIKVPSGLGKVGRVAGKVLGPAAAALDVADEKSKGSGWARSLAKGAAVAAGGALGGAAGSVAGPVGSIGGATAGSIAASKAFDVAAGANAKERKAMASANRQRQAGTSIKGIGGKTTFDTKKNTMTTGVGSQRKTVGLAKTGVVQRGGQSVAGHLAYKGGQAVYKAGPSAQSLAKTSSNPLERIGRSLFAGAYKKHDTAKAQQALTKARQSDVARNKALGVKALPGK